MSTPRYLHFQNVRSNMDLMADIVTPDPPVDTRHDIRHRTDGLIPLTGHAFCGCYVGRRRQSCCTCGEGGKILEWVWDVDTKNNCTHLMNYNKDVRFHLHFSRGTAAIRGSQPITANQHFWEIKMTSLVYGTDMMVGIGTKDANVRKFSNSFCSILGIDNQTWGLSYTGLFHHKGVSREYASGFGQGSIIGVHLDMWNGTLSFYKNRQALGVACTGLKGKALYPMVSSTAARSGMRIIHSVSFPSSLQFICCVTLRKSISADRSVFQSLNLPPGLQRVLAHNLGWLLGETDKESMFQRSIPVYPPCCRKGPDTFFHQRLTCTDCNTPVFATLTDL